MLEILFGIWTSLPRGTGRKSPCFSTGYAIENKRRKRKENPHPPFFYFIAIKSAADCLESPREKNPGIFAPEVFTKVLLNYEVNLGKFDLFQNESISSAKGKY